jgi:hypothetical protein
MTLLLHIDWVGLAVVPLLALAALLLTGLAAARAAKGRRGRGAPARAATDVALKLR